MNLEQLLASIEEAQVPKHAQVSVTPQIYNGRRYGRWTDTLTFTWAGGHPGVYCSKTVYLGSARKPSADLW